MTKAEREKLKEAAKQMDWQQVVMNGGPPCFWLGADGRFCGRADCWAGHGAHVHHRYAPFDALLSLLIEEIEQLEQEAFKGICVYCGHVEQYESLEHKGSGEGNALRVAHIRVCETRPEKKLIAYVEQLQKALTKFGEHAEGCKSNERYPPPPCDCGLAAALIPVSQVSKGKERIAKLEAALRESRPYVLAMRDCLMPAQLVDSSRKVLRQCDAALTRTSEQEEIA